VRAVEREPGRQEHPVEQGDKNGDTPVRWGSVRWRELTGMVAVNDRVRQVGN
jgi:hypothetical protein